MYDAVYCILFNGRLCEWCSQPLSMRIDPLLAELSGYISVNADGSSSSAATAATSSVAIRTSCIEALATVLTFGGDKATAAGLERVQSLIMGLVTGLVDEEEQVRTAISRCAGALAIHAEPMLVSDLIIGLLDTCRPASMASKPQVSVCAAVVAAGAATQTSGAKASEMREELFTLLSAAAADERAPVRIAAFE
jgi:hypothetical protein